MFRGVAQFGGALCSGRRGRKFESCHLDQREISRNNFLCVFISFYDVSWHCAQKLSLFAGVAELADALDLGSSGNAVQVQVLSPVPLWVVIRDLRFLITTFNI